MGHHLQAPEDRWALVRAMEGRALHRACLGQLVQVASDAVRRLLQFGGQLAGQARLCEAYDQAREYVMRGGRLPEEPVAVLGQAAASPPVPASPEAPRRAERKIAEIFGKGSAEPGNDDHPPATGKMAAAGLDR